MTNRNNQLNEVLMDSIIALDTYVETLSKFAKILEEKGKAADYQKEVQNLTRQNQSLLTALSIIRKIKSTKLSLLSGFANPNDIPRDSDQSINIKLKLNFREDNRKNTRKYIAMKMSREAYNKLRHHNKSINLLLYLKDYHRRPDPTKAINLKIRFKDPEP